MSAGDEMSKVESTDEGSAPSGAVVSDDSDQGRHLESLFELEGLGAHLLKGEDPDEYVRKLREGWD